jgi:hypothetical protein
MGICISPYTWFNPTHPSQTRQIKCTPPNHGLICTQIDSKTGESIKIDRFTNINFPPATQQLCFGSQVIETSLNLINYAQSNHWLNSSFDFQSKVLRTAFTGQPVSSLVDLAFAEKGIGLNINILI